MKLSWTTEKRRVIDLSPADYNPRQMTEAQAKELRKSLQKFGLVEIPAIDQDGTILAGHMRVATMIDLGMGEETIDVRVPNRKLTDAEAMEYNLRSNKNTGEWDLAKLFAMPEALLEEVGFSNKEIQKLVDGNTTVEEDDYDTDKGLKLPVRVERGQIWQLGTHRLMCGDSTAKEDVEKLMDGKKADMVFTDPPYGMKLDTDYSKLPGTSSKYDKVIGDDEDFDASILFQLVDSPIWYLWGADYYCFSIPRYRDGSYIVWSKSQSEDENKVIGSRFEMCWVYPKQKKDVWFERSINQSSERLGEHPTQKPVALGVRAIKKSSEIGSIVLDLFLGSGSTLIACEQTGRVCYGMEIDPKYCTVIIDRWEKLTNQKAVCVSSS